ncbi:GNAT family N-acetyltransferase [Bifidobacterium samirii]|uniref:GNAT family acetyltransferase n=1 Tax=Bifidobacterium samirii TaxID=2306974 RepID=A0A430FVX8_9BIFI|nr:GNAT family N-acetyltransferase [Bifidobacterium samirii]RSX58103.1 GNAT family acetyltransferase [Bifidobacterium samirii]
MAATIATSIAAQGGDHQSHQSDPHSGTAAPTVRYRTMSWDDVDAIVDLFDRTWPPEDTLAGTPAGLLVSRYFTLHYLEHTTYGIVAERDDGMFAGVILARVAGARPLYDVVPAMMAQARADLAGNEAALESLRGLDRAFDVELELEASCGVNDTTQGELELFVVNPDVRGAGVGGGLWRRAQAHLAQAGVESYYLHTDSDCDVSFYDHKGMTRVAERLHAAASAPAAPAAPTAPSSEGAADELWAFADDMFIYRGPVDRAALDALTGHTASEAETALASVASLREDWSAPAEPLADAAEPGERGR